MDVNIDILRRQLLSSYSDLEHELKEFINDYVSEIYFVYGEGSAFKDLEIKVNYLREKLAVLACCYGVCEKVSDLSYTYEFDRICNPFKLS